MNEVLAPSVYPFSVAAAVMLGLVVLEGASLLLGHSASGLIDKTLDIAPENEVGVGHDAGEGGSLSGALNWINLGGIPLMALLILATAAFAVLGYAIQAVSTSLAGPLPVGLASLGAFAGAVPATRYGSRLVSGIVPRDETYAVTLADLVGLTGRVTVGPLDQGMPGSVSVRDRHDNRHSLKAVAAEGQDPIPQGATVLLVDRAGQVFTAIPAPDSLVK